MSEVNMRRSAKLVLLAIALLAAGYTVGAKPIRSPYELVAGVEPSTQGIAEEMTTNRKPRSGLFGDFLTMFDYGETSSQDGKDGGLDDSFSWDDLFDYFDDSEETYLVCRNCTVVINQQNQTSSSPEITQPGTSTPEVKPPTTAANGAKTSPQPNTAASPTSSGAPTSATAAQTPTAGNGGATTATTAAGSSPQTAVSPASSGAPTDTTAASSSTGTVPSPPSTAGEATEATASPAAGP